MSSADTPEKALSTSIFETGSLTVESLPSRLIGQWNPGILLYTFLKLRLQAPATKPSFLCGFYGMNSGLPAYKTRTLLTWPSLISSQPWTFYSFYNLKNSFKSEFLVSTDPHSEVRDQVGQGCTRNSAQYLLKFKTNTWELIKRSPRASLPSSWIRVSMK